MGSTERNGHGSTSLDLARSAPTSATGHGWVGIAANPASGLGSGRRRVERLVEELKRRDLRARVAWTLAERSALVAESARDPDCRCLVAAGGDGTVASAGQRVSERPDHRPADRDREPVRPSLRPEPRPRATGRHHRSGPDRFDRPGSDRRSTVRADGGHRVRRRRRDPTPPARIGRAGVVRPDPPRRVRRVRAPVESEYRFPTLTISIADPGREETLTGTTVFLFNLPSYALGLPFVPLACGDDGWLDLVVFRDAGPFQALRYLWLVVRGVHLDCPSVYHRKVHCGRRLLDRGRSPSNSTAIPADSSLRTGRWTAAGPSRCCPTPSMCWYRAPRALVVRIRVVKRVGVR